MFRTPLLLLLVLFASITAFAQSQANTGNIEGRVTDPNAAAVPNVTVTATNLANGLQKSAQTNDEGVYRIVFLQPGAYKVETSGAQGFVPAAFTNVIVTVGGQTPLDIQLAVGNTTVAMVDVSAEGQVVETSRTSISSVVNERAIQRYKAISPSADKKARSTVSSLTARTTTTLSLDNQSVAREHVRRTSSQKNPYKSFR